MLMRRPQVTRWQVTLAAFLALVGFLLVIQVRAGRTIRREVALPTLRVRELAVLVQQQEEAVRTLQAEIADLRGKLAEYESAAAQGRSSAETLAKQVASYRMVMGLAAVEGPGVVVRLSERRGEERVVSDGRWRVDPSRGAIASGGRYRPAVWGSPPMYPWGWPRLPRPNEIERKP